MNTSRSPADDTDSSPPSLIDWAVSPEVRRASAIRAVASILVAAKAGSARTRTAEAMAKRSSQRVIAAPPRRGTKTRRATHGPDAHDVRLVHITGGSLDEAMKFAARVAHGSRNFFRAYGARP